MRDDAPLRVLLIEDDRRLASLIAEFLELRSLSVVTVHDGAAGLARAVEPGWDCVLLDLMLPGLGGMEVCRRVRARSDVPIVMLTALASEGERVLGLESGADAYVCKPFSTAELLAQVRALARRHRGELRAPDARRVAGDVEVDPSTRRASVGGRPLELTSQEFALLVCFVGQPGRVLSRERLLELTHGDPGEAYDRSIDGHISRLRQKLGDDARNPVRLKTVRGAGYMLVATP